jgi:predicted ATPase
MKSLVSTQDDRGSRQYAMLDTTRAYALEKRSESGERERVARLHADSISRICSSG